MPKPLKVLVWVAVFGACVGAGAYMASRSDPFPPGVTDPGERPSVTPTHTPPSPAVWTLTMDSATRHTLHVGGSCRSDWQIEGSITIQPKGTTAGHATARLQGPVSCDFPQSQVQTKAIELVLTGTLVGNGLRLALSEAGRSPVGSQDLGGFTNTLSLIRPTFQLSGGSDAARASVNAARPDGDLGTYRSDSHIRLSLQ